MVDSTPLIFPQLGPIYEALFPWAEALLRAVVGLALVPHGLRNTFGMFPSTGVQSHNLTELAGQLDRDGYRPGKFWAPAISITQLVGKWKVGQNRSTTDRVGVVEALERESTPPGVAIAALIKETLDGGD